MTARPTPSKARVLAAIERADCALSAKDIYRALGNDSIALGSIYRILRELVRERLVWKSQTPRAALFRRRIRP